MTGRKRTYKITGESTDPHIVKLVHPNNKIFRRVRLVNVKKSDNKPVAAELVLDQKSYGLLFTKRSNNRAEVCGFVDENTGMFIMDEDGDVGDTAHIKFLKMAAKKAVDAMNAEVLRQGREDEDTRADYRTVEDIGRMLEDYLYSPTRFNADMGKQLANFASRPMPNVNEYIVYADDEAWNQDIYVTKRVPYKNPAKRKINDNEKKIVDDFLDVFFDEYNKQAFSWYMGACLSNLPIYDERVSRMGVMTSSHAGSGKSSLMSAIVNGVFTEDYCSVKEDFDRFFLKTNRFGTDSLSVKRLTVYSEADWGIKRDGSCDHNFDGLNVSAIKSMITDGFITKEPKFGDPMTVRSSGFHMVLTNYLPCITKEDVAMRRRILPILMRPTSMVDKAEKLGLMGRNNLEKFVQDNAEIFASYFVQTFMDNQFMFIRDEYDYDEETEAVTDSQVDLDEAARQDRKALMTVKAQGFIAFLKKAQEQTGIDMSLLIEDANHALGGKSPDGVDDHMRHDGNVFYIDGSKSFLMRYGRGGAVIRKLLQEHYGSAMRKFHKRMFAIPLNQTKTANESSEAKADVKMADKPAENRAEENIASAPAESSSQTVNGTDQIQASVQTANNIAPDSKPETRKSDGNITS